MPRSTYINLLGADSSGSSLAHTNINIILGGTNINIILGCTNINIILGAY
jgi:hypothetical protein